MKKIYRYLGSMLLMAGMTFTACSPEDFDSPNEAGIPVATDFESAVSIEVDQSTNYAYFNYDSQPGITPVWIIDGEDYSTSFSFSKYYRKAGDYSVEVKFSNLNGISDGSITKTFHVDKTVMNGFGGFVYESEFNLWAKAQVNAPTFWYAPGWAQIADPAYTFKNGSYTVTLPEATTDTWMAQMALRTDISTASTSNYDFSVIFTSTMDHPGVTVKLEDADGGGAIYYCEKKIALTANEPVCFWMSDMPGIDIANVALTLDFGGNAAGSVITIENIVLKDHANDDGTVIPEVAEPEPTWVALDSEDNLWNQANFTNTYFYANPDWSPRPSQELKIDGRTYTISFPDATEAQWQNQVAFSTVLSADVETEYDFCIKMKASQDVRGVTVKLVQTDEPDVKHDGNFFFADNVDLVADTEVKFYRTKVKAPEAMHAISLVLDFGGNPANTNVEIKDIIIQTHRD